MIRTIPQARFFGFDLPQGLNFDRDQGAGSGSRPSSHVIAREAVMPLSDMEMLGLIIGAFVLFGGVLGWASWEQSRKDSKKKA